MSLVKRFSGIKNNLFGAIFKIAEFCRDFSKRACDFFCAKWTKIKIYYIQDFSYYLALLSALELVFHLNGVIFHMAIN